MYGIPDVLSSRPLDTRGWPVHPPTRALYGDKGFLFLVADGVGGYAGGETASRLVVKEVARRYYTDPSLELATSLQRVIEAANRRLRAAQTQPGMPNRMATTITAGIIHQDQLIVASVGDSRAYLVHHHEAFPVTGDHSIRQRLVDRGDAVGSSNRSHGDRNRITRSLGSHDQVGVDIWWVSLESGDRILFCSDGLSQYVDLPNLGMLAGQGNLQQAVNGLVDAAFDRGSPDNITAILIAWHRTSNRRARQES
jgi:protein phosphatase